MARRRKQSKDEEIRKRLQRSVRPLIRSHDPAAEDKLLARISRGLAQLGQFYRDADGGGFYFWNHDKRLYPLGTHASHPFGQLMTYLLDASVSRAALRVVLDRLIARATQEAPMVQVHGIAYNSPDLDAIAVNDFGGGMWYRTRGGSWEHRPNGSEGLFFWTPRDGTERWEPTFSTTSGVTDEDHLSWFVDQPHFADDVLTQGDQRLILRVLLLAPLFPSQVLAKPVQAHLAQAQHRRHDTGKTMAGKLIGHLFVGSKFQPTPAEDKKAGDLDLDLMDSPFVLLDNIDTSIKWLNDFLATYATGRAATRRKLYTDTDRVTIPQRGVLCLTSRKPFFNREDVASRVIPLRFRPIDATERRTEPELLGPLDDRRGRVLAGVLAAAAKIQDAFPEQVPPSSALRLADFERFGWRVAASDGRTREWGLAMRRLAIAQTEFVFEGEAIIPVLRSVLERAGGEIRDRHTGDFFQEVSETWRRLCPEAFLPASAGELTKQIREHQGSLEALLGVWIGFRTLHGATLISLLPIPPRTSASPVGVGQVSEVL